MTNFILTNVKYCWLLFTTVVFSSVHKNFRSVSHIIIVVSWIHSKTRTVGANELCGHTASLVCALCITSPVTRGCTPRMPPPRPLSHHRRRRRDPRSMFQRRRYTSRPLERRATGIRQSAFSTVYVSSYSVVVVL